MKIKELLTKKYGGLPGWAWFAVAVGGVAIGLYFYSRNKSTAAATTTSATTDATSASTNASATDNSVGTTGYGDYSAVGSTAGGANGTGNTVINLGNAATNPTNWLTTLVLTGSEPIPFYDSAGTPGATTLGNEIGTIPPNTTVTATGPELVGAWNQPNGSENWYPVVYNGQAGFISAYYVANASSSIQNQPVAHPIPDPGPGAGPSGSSGKTYTTTKSASLEVKPGQSSGKVTVPSGSTVNLLSNTTENGPGSLKNKKYYNVSYKGKNGWIGDDAISV